jgi:hypothetical protein
VNFRALSRPPRIFLSKVSCSRTFSKASFHSKRSSRDLSLLALVWEINCRRKSLGMRRTSTPTGRETAPIAIDKAHCVLSRRMVDKALPPTDIMIACPQIVMMLMPIKNKFRLIPSKMLNLLSRRRLLKEVSLYISRIYIVPRPT